MRLPSSRTLELWVRADLRLERSPGRAPVPDRRGTSVRESNQLFGERLSLLVGLDPGTGLDCLKRAALSQRVARDSIGALVVQHARVPGSIQR